MSLASMFHWFRRGARKHERVAVCPTENGLAMALAERQPGGGTVVHWVEFIEPAAPAQPPEPPPEKDPEGGGRRSGDRRANDRRQPGGSEPWFGPERRQSDRRTGPRRVGPRRSRNQDSPPVSPVANAGELARWYEPLLAAINRLDLRPVPCTTLLRPGDYSLVMVDSPDVPANELRSALRWQLKDLIDFHIDDAVIDVFAVPERDGHAGRRVYAVAARRERVQHLVNLLDAVGCNLTTIDIPELALLNIAERLPEDEAGVALIAFGPDQGLLTLTRDGELYFSRRVDCGTARLLAAQDGSELTPALEAVLDGLTIEVQRSLDFYERHFGQASVSALVLSPIPGLNDQVCQYLEAQLGVRTRWLNLEVDCGLEEARSREATLFGIAAIGAALREDEVAL